VILLFTDFGSQDIYIGQFKAALLRACGTVPVIDLLHEAPDHDITLSAHLLAALVASSSQYSDVVLAVVDPGVGGARRPVVVQADGIWYVGPDNGLLSVVAERSKEVRVWEIIWRPQVLSASFHGRDLFVPIAAMLATGVTWEGALLEIAGLDVSLGATSLYQVIYVDHYGNALTGIRASELQHDAKLSVNQNQISYERVFSEVPEGNIFWYENSLGLVEIAGNCVHAARQLQITTGMTVTLLTKSGR